MRSEKYSSCYPVSGAEGGAACDGDCESHAQSFRLEARVPDRLVSRIQSLKSNTADRGRSFGQNHRPGRISAMVWCSL